MNFFKKNFLKRIAGNDRDHRIVSVGLLIAVLFLCGGVHSTVATKYMKGTELNQIDEIYAPGGYDNNDPVVILSYEEYDMSCEELVSHDVNVDEGRKIIYLNSRKISYAASSECSESYEPVYSEYEIGELEKGLYTVIGSGPKPVKEKLLIRPSSTDSIDRFSYPKILEARMGQRSNGNVYLYVDITLEDSCEYVESVEVKRRGVNFWELYPKMKRVQGDFCERSTLIQTQEVLLGEIPHDTHIFYIRTEDGASNFHYETLI